MFLTLQKRFPEQRPLWRRYGWFSGPFQSRLAPLSYRIQPIGDGERDDDDDDDDGDEEVVLLWPLGSFNS